MQLIAINLPEITYDILEEQKLKIEIDSLRLELNQIFADIEWFNETLTTATTREKLKLIQVVDTIERLAKEYEKIGKIPEEICLILEHYNRYIGRYEEPIGKKDEEAPKNSRDNKRACSKLFREISRKCHPDKVKNTDRVEYFHQAVAAYERLDYQALLEIAETLRTGKNNKIVRPRLVLVLKKQRDQLKNQIRENKCRAAFYRASLCKEDPKNLSSIIREEKREYIKSILKLRESLETFQMMYDMLKD